MGTWISTSGTTARTRTRTCCRFLQASGEVTRLNLNWSISPGVQRYSFNGWSVHTDITPAGGFQLDL
jgi:hypothetical protein